MTSGVVYPVASKLNDYVVRPVAGGVNEYIVDPATKYVVDPATKYVVDPVARTAPQFYRTGDLQKLKFLCLFNLKCGLTFYFLTLKLIFSLIMCIHIIPLFNKIY